MKRGKLIFEVVFLFANNKNSFNVASNCRNLTSALGSAFVWWERGVFGIGQFNIHSFLSF